ncbi:LysM domain-containing protein [Micromonospora pisi]|uniref:LysM domain-containing protein n=1 Tax=Micromonospora pisi TaxID=589240 RepID=A0A495JJ89_9ACTN|nr:LysM domain-containing protein [Micromonospora pisi]RKR89003.1 LysM domain-containing protein [Micromonospora pisi]
MPAARVSAARRTGQILTGLCSLLVLVGLVVGAPIALLAVAGNPLPDHVPTLAEIGDTLTSRDDGQLFLRALAIVGWLGWATFALSVLVELPARILRRPAIRLPGLRRQQRAVAALVGAAALILVTSPAATAATSVAAGAVAAAPYAPVTATTAGYAPAALAAGPSTTEYAPSAWAAAPYGRTGAAPLAQPVTGVGAAPRALAAPSTPADEPAPVYRVEEGDYLGTIADRYLGDFNRFRDLAQANEIRNPDRIKPGQLLHLPADAEDRGVREHATGLVATPPAAKPVEPPTNGWPTPEKPAPAPSQEQPRQQPAEVTTYAVGASRASVVNSVNRPLAVSAVIAVASIVGAQIGAVLGLRRRPATSTASGVSDGGRHRRD